MYALYQVMPDPDVVVALEPEELGAKLLFLLRGARPFSPYNCENELRNYAEGRSYPQRSTDAVSQALREAFAWLSAQGLIVSAPYGDGSWMVLSRRALAFESEPDVALYTAARRLRREALHASIADPVWSAFIRGEFDVAVFQAMKAVEVLVREASGLHGLLGVNLMRAAFHPTTGPLTDQDAEAGEREARAGLFAAAIGSFKNPHSHRDVALDHPDEAIEIIMLSCHLLRIVDARRAASAEAVGP